MKIRTIQKKLKMNVDKRVSNESKSRILSKNFDCKVKYFLY